MRKRTIAIIAVIILAIAAYAGYQLTRPKPLNYTSAKVERGDVVQTVSATGAVEAAEKVDLKFLSSERIQEVDAKVGDSVKQGQLLAKLDTSKLDAQLSQAQAGLAAAQADLQSVTEGATSEQIQVSQTAVDNAQIALKNAQQSLEDTKAAAAKDVSSSQSAVDSAQVALANAQSGLTSTQSANQSSLNNAYDSAWDGVTSALASCDDALNTNSQVLDNDDAEDTLGVLDSRTMSNSKASKAAAEKSYGAALSFKNGVAGNRTPANIDAAIVRTQDALEKTRVTLSDTYAVLQATVTSSKLSQAELDSLKGQISSSRGNVNNVISALNAKQQAISTQKVANASSQTSAQNAVNSASSALSQAQNGLAAAQSSASSRINAAQNAIYTAQGGLKAAQDSLSQVRAKAEPAKVAASQAGVDKARAAADLIQKQLADMVLTAPQDGVVTAVNGKVGEVSSPTEAFLSMFIPNGFEIKANVSEVEIAKVKVGDAVDVTFDALGSDQKFQGQISEIDPAETVVSGVIYYKVTTIFTGDGQVVKPGMTANLDIQTAKKQNVLKIPFQALKEKDGYKYVQTVVDNKVQEIPVDVGLKGDSDYEVVSGLKEGQSVVTFLGQ